MRTPDSNTKLKTKPGPKPKKPLAESDLQGFKFFKRLRGLLDGLRSCASHPNRLLHFDGYAMAVLFYVFNPAIITPHIMLSYTQQDTRRTGLLMDVPGIPRETH